MTQWGMERDDAGISVAWRVSCVNESNPRHGAMWHSYSSAIADAKKADGEDHWLIEGLTVNEVEHLLAAGFAFEDEPVLEEKHAKN